MLLRLGNGHHISNLIQTLGRATGNCRDVLDANDFDHVTVLTMRNDLDACTKMQTFINETVSRIGKGDTLFQAVTGAKEKIPDDANFLRHTLR